MLKGIPLLLEVYKDTGARFLGDADILIPEHAAKKAVRLMQMSGWRSQSQYVPQLDFFADESLVRMSKEATFANDMQIEIDIHWRLFDTTQNGKTIMPFEELSTRSIPIMFKEKTYRSLSREDMLLHVIVHGAEGNVHRTLRWIPDACAIIRDCTLDWEYFFTQTNTSGWNAEVYYALSYLTEHNFISVPKTCIASIEALKPDEESLKRYYKKANPPFSLLGNFPKLWRTYWQYESRGTFPMSFFRCIDYITHAWGFSQVWSLPGFIFNKYKKRALFSLGFTKDIRHTA